jgi:hypothetical protein
MIILKTLPAICIQVGESLKRKTGAKINQFLKQYGPDTDTARRPAENELDKEARRNT